jgi:hypothetical protein
MISYGIDQRRACQTALNERCAPSTKHASTLEEVTRDILALEAETEGLLKKLASFNVQPGRSG